MADPNRCSVAPPLHPTIKDYEDYLDIPRLIDKAKNGLPESGFWIRLKA